MRNGKIAKMPEWVREKLNERMEKGESGKTILAWMNEELDPGLKAIPGFNGVPISKQNLSQWRRGGFREWQLRRKIETADAGMKDLGRTVEMAPLAENLLLKVMGLYALVVNPWDGKANAGFEAEVRILRGLLHDATLMQRAVTQADKLKEAIRQRKREREDLWGGGGLVEAMREMLRKKREERIDAELQRREDARKEKESAEGMVKEEVVSESGLVAVGQSKSKQEAGLDPTEGEAGEEGHAEAQRRGDVKEGKDLDGVVTVGQSGSKQKAGLDATEGRLGVNAEAQGREDAKNAGDLGLEGGETR